MKSAQNHYFDRLEQVNAEIESRMIANAAVSVEPADFIFDQPIPYHTTARKDSRLHCLRGRNNPRAHAHASVCRMDSGRYELTMYFL